MLYNIDFYHKSFIWWLCSLSNLKFVRWIHIHISTYRLLRLELKSMMKWIKEWSCVNFNPFYLVIYWNQILWMLKPSQHSEYVPTSMSMNRFHIEIQFKCIEYQKFKSDTINSIQFLTKWLNDVGSLIWFVLYVSKFTFVGFCIKFAIENFTFYGFTNGFNEITNSLKICLF